MINSLSACMCVCLSVFLSVCLSLSNNGFSWNFSHWDALRTGKQLIKNKLEFLSNIWFQNPEDLRQKLEKKGHEAAERHRDIVHQKSAKARPKTVKVLVGIMTSWHIKMHACWQEFWTSLLIGWQQSEIRLENWKDFNITRKADGPHPRLGKSCDWWFPTIRSTGAELWKFDMQMDYPWRTSLFFFKFTTTTNRTDKKLIVNIMTPITLGVCA